MEQGGYIGGILGRGSCRVPCRALLEALHEALPEALHEALPEALHEALPEALQKALPEPLHKALPEALYEAPSKLYTELPQGSTRSSLKGEHTEDNTKLNFPFLFGTSRYPP